MSSAPAKHAKPPGAAGRRLLLALLAVVVVAVLLRYRSELTLPRLAQREAQLREFQAARPQQAMWAAAAVYVAVTGLSLPGATVLTLAFAWFFGFWSCLVLVSFASTAGATLAFLLSRYLLREFVQRQFGDRLAGFHQSLARDGAYYLFTLRLIPVAPFFVINVVMGLTRISTLTFWWVSQLGMLPGTAVYVYAGASMPDLQTLADQGVKGIIKWELLIAFALLGLFPLAARRLLKPRASRGL